MSMNQIPSRAPLQFRSPPKRSDGKAPEPRPDHNYANIEDAVDKSRDSSWTLGKVTLAAVGLVAAATSVAHAQAAPTEISAADLRVDGTNEVVTASETSAVKEAVTESQDLDLSIDRTWGGTVKLKGDWGDTSVNMTTQRDFWGNQDLDGKWGDKKVDLDLDRTLLGNYELDGKWGSSKVDLEIDRTLWGNHDVSGNWGNAEVDLNFDKDWGGNYDIDGTWNGQKVDLNVSRTWGGSIKVKGVWAGETVNFKASKDWGGNLDVHGETPEEAVVPWLVSTHINRVESESN